MKGLEPVGDVSAGDWLAEALPDELGTVGAVVPRGFAAYARVLHPVECDADRPSLTWADVCRRTGRTPHARVQWAAITKAAGTASAGWDDGDVQVGNLAPPALRALIDVLAPVTGAQDCFHALWEGWGWVDGGGVQIVAASNDGRAAPTPPVVPGVPPDVWALSRLRLPHRDYLLFRGPLRAALDLGWHTAPFGFEPQSPSLLWPSDRAWCVGTEIDFDSTLVGGSADLIRAVPAAPGLEAWPVGPDDDLTVFGDRLN